MRRREFVAGLALASSGAFPARAQQGRRTYSILWVSTEARPDPFIAGFRDGMRERGYIEGQNLAFVLHYAAGDPSALRGILWDLMKVPADLIVSSGPAILAMRAAAAKFDGVAADSAPPSASRVVRKSLGQSAGLR